MNQFTSRLKKEVDAKVEQIECSEVNTMNKSLEACHVLADSFNQLKTFILQYNFKDEEEEILFFKEIKPSVSLFGFFLSFQTSQYRSKKPYKSLNL